MQREIIKLLYNVLVNTDTSQTGNESLFIISLPQNFLKEISYL